MIELSVLLLLLGALFGARELYWRRRINARFEWEGNVRRAQRLTEATTEYVARAYIERKERLRTITARSMWEPREPVIDGPVLVYFVEKDPTSVIFMPFEGSFERRQLQHGEGMRLSPDTFLERYKNPVPAPTPPAWPDPMAWAADA